MAGNRQIDRDIALKFMGWTSPEEYQGDVYACPPGQGATKQVPLYSSDVRQAFFVVAAMQLIRSVGSGNDIWINFLCGLTGLPLSYLENKELPDVAFATLFKGLSNLFSAPADIPLKICEAAIAAVNSVPPKEGSNA